MSNAFRRYEILLPRQFNDGSAIPDALITETVLDVESQFGAVSSETQIIRGYWQHEGQPHRDELARIFVDVPGYSGKTPILSGIQRTAQDAVPTDRHLDDDASDRNPLAFKRDFEDWWTMIKECFPQEN